MMQREPHSIRSLYAIVKVPATPAFWRPNQMRREAVCLAPHPGMRGSRIRGGGYLNRERPSVDTNYRAPWVLAATILMLAAATPLRAASPASPSLQATSEAAYWTAIQPPLSVFHQSVVHVAALLNQPMDALWAMDVSAHITAAREAHRLIARVEPPPSLIELDSLIQTGLNHCRRSLDSFVVAVEQRNPLFVHNTGVHMQNCRNYMVTMDRMAANGVIPIRLSALPAEPVTSLPISTPTLMPTPTLSPAMAAGYTAPGAAPLILPTPVPTNMPAPFVSQGLGLSQEQWEQRYGPAQQDLPGFVRYGPYVVAFRDGNAWYIERQWTTADPSYPDAARIEGETLAPSDRSLVHTYSPEGRPETVVHLYASESLKGRFGADVWTGGEPGNFTIQYSVFDGDVTRMIVATGNNP